MRQLVKKIAHPFLNFWYQRKAKKTNRYTKHGITLDILPGVFHPGVFLSTNIFIDYLKTLSLENKTVLELGAGSGMISFFCTRQGATTTATDINKNALEGLQINAKSNGIQLTVQHSDLFEHLDASDFDLILINPPYYPKSPKNEQEQAFFCGENFEYFERLCEQLQASNLRDNSSVLMILSEDCDLKKIQSIAASFSLKMSILHEVKKRQEQNYIFSISPC